MNKENSKIPSKLPGLGTKKPTPSDLASEQATLTKKVANPVSRMTRATSGTVSSLSKTNHTRSTTTKPVVKTAVKSAVSRSTTRTTKPVLPAKPTLSTSTAEPPLKRKRKEYDVKGRLQDLEEHHNYTTTQLSHSQALITSMTEKLSQSESTIAELMDFRKGLESAVKSREEEKEGLARELGMVVGEREVGIGLIKELINKHKVEIEDMKRKYESDLEAKDKQMQVLRKEMEGLRVDLEGERAQVQQFKITIQTMNAAGFAMESELAMVKSKLNGNFKFDPATENLLCDRDETIKTLNQEKLELEGTVTKLDSTIREHETTRRALHNTIQELKGNIRVFCRMRPLLDGETEDSTLDESGPAQISFSGDDGIELRLYGDSASGKQMLKPYNFQFDKVFQPVARQAEVFDEISQLVQSALDGYNVCIFAYGQTGSGKTFTMEGAGNVSLDNPDCGMIPRAVQQIYTACEALKDKGWEYTMEAQFLEIYNETLRDLLDSPDVTKKMDIKHDNKNKTTVTEALNVMVDSPEKVFSLLQKASQNRAVAATNCNERSSRSHSVFTLKLTGKNTLTDENCDGVLNLIDLAGSERLSSSKSTGDRLKETQAINKSLSSLGDVIASLANKEAHVPYRNSKLTYLLQNSLGGNSKTLMFVNVSPLMSSVNETLCSLRFATKVNSCQIGTARKQISFK